MENSYANVLGIGSFFFQLIKLSITNNLLILFTLLIISMQKLYVKLKNIQKSKLTIKKFIS